MGRKRRVESDKDNKKSEAADKVLYMLNDLATEERFLQSTLQNLNDLHDILKKEEAEILKNQALETSTQ
ncbi:hypothetical protein O9G_003306 [Rozella allomycis CSF55]|uniref:Uncharacterized protein n=1 Tax=Rozella allomycis (strain CSF55) TaxID=988480 RepID=A0A075AUI5_ROZAC|nr:hypothetical protein O9G_003306 [Rozella allomycis CSF55]|eukprot:EPZ32167.1 hypothetical protein O9G_003306 [Rozella allomycis CSF55]